MALAVGLVVTVQVMAFWELRVLDVAPNGVTLGNVSPDFVRALERMEEREAEQEAEEDDFEPPPEYDSRWGEPRRRGSRRRDEDLPEVLPAPPQPRAAAPTAGGGDARALAARLSAADGVAAMMALRQLGPPAEPEVLRALNDPAPAARQRARRLLAEWRTAAEALLRQCVLDLRSGDGPRQAAALEYLATAPVDAALRSDVLWALVGLAGLAEALARWATRENLPALQALHRQAMAADNASVAGAAASALEAIGGRQ